VWICSAFTSTVVWSGTQVQGETSENDGLTALGKGVLRVRKKVDFNAEWRFIKKDVTGAHEHDFDDSDWRKLDLPHDWSIEGPFRADLASGTGYLPGGIGWYRKTFRPPDGFKEYHVPIEFDGVYNNSEVWCNGVFLGKRPYGYVSFGYDLTPHLKTGDAPNVVAVRVDHSDYADSRWYTGSGIYRDVHLVLTKPVHVKRYGIYITTPQVTKGQASV
jgi:beta-galactosidase